VPVRIFLSSQLNHLTNPSPGFDKTGDFILGDGIAQLSGLLSRGVKVALVYGDKDYQCNWLGGEALSLAIGSSTFKDAGYEDIHTNASYVGGVVRQVGNLSFARVYQSGHERTSSFPPSLHPNTKQQQLTYLNIVPYYQPETGYQIFNRVMFDSDVATGNASCAEGYVSKGPKSAWSMSELPKAQGKANCYVWDVLETCTPAEGLVLRSGKAVVKDWVLVGNGTASI
jgi:hypothetical protein